MTADEITTQLEQLKSTRQALLQQVQQTVTGMQQQISELQRRQQEAVQQANYELGSIAGKMELLNGMLPEEERVEVEEIELPVRAE